MSRRQPLPIICGYCGDTGWESVMGHTVPCPPCVGTGLVPGDLPFLTPCPTCNGTGSKMVTRIPCRHLTHGVR